MLKINSLFILLLCYLNSFAQSFNYPAYPISLITTEDSTGVADSLNVNCRLSGVVYGGNFRPNGLDFQILNIEDGQQEGIEVFSSNQVSNYIVKEGDSLDVYGRVMQFRGRTQLLVDSIVRLDSFAVVPSPVTATAVNEATESKLIQYNNMIITSVPSNVGFSYNLIASSGNQSFQIRIDGDAEIQDSLQLNPLSVGDTICSLIGFGSQFDTSNPLLSGYQIFPFWYKDLDISSCKGACTQPTAAISPLADTICNRDTLNLVDNSSNTNSNAVYLWDFNNDGLVDSKNRNSRHTYSRPGKYFIELTVFQGACTDTIVDSVFVLDSFNQFDTVVVCKGDSYTFPDNFTINSVDSNFNYVSRLSSSTICDSIISTQILLSADTVNNGVVRNGNSLVAVQSNAVYQWINCTTNSTILNANNQSFTAVATGDYAVEISNGLCKDTSSCFTVIVTGLKNESGRGSLTIFPNPSTNGVFNLSEKSEGIVYDFSARIVAEFSNSSVINLSDHPNGIYFLKTSGNSIVRLLKK